MLHIRARFADEPAGFEPVSLEAATAQVQRLAEHMDVSSNGTLVFTCTVADIVVTLPQTVAQSKYSAYSFSTLLTNATAAAKAANPSWDSAKYDHTIIMKPKVFMSNGLQATVTWIDSAWHFTFNVPPGTWTPASHRYPGTYPTGASASPG